MIIVADNLQPVNQVVAGAISNMDPIPLQNLVRRCLQAGAQLIDINAGPLPKSPARHFSFLVETVQSVTSLPLILDTTNPRALEAGLKACRNPAIINGFSLEPFKIEHILPLAVHYEADIIGYLLGPRSEVPVDAEEMMAMAVELYQIFLNSGLTHERLIIDPVIAPVSWDNGIRHNQAVLSFIRNLPDLLGVPMRTVAGISNLATGPLPKQRKIELEQTFLPMLAAAGLDMALINVHHKASVQTAKMCETLLGEKVFAWTGI
jgi:5-methyltetrahydrofolate corrinoid/iron sulfur protein methyltransferase